MKKTKKAKIEDIIGFIVYGIILLPLHIVLLLIVAIYWAVDDFFDLIYK